MLTAALMLVSSDVLGQAAGPAVASPCAACLVMTLTPAQVAALPERLAGARLLLRIDASVSPAAWESQLAELRRKGAGVGLHIVGVPGEADPALAERIDILLIEVPASTPLDNIAYRLKAAFTRARAASETATLVLAGARAVMTAVRTDLDPYVDAVLPIGATSEVSESQPKRTWLAGAGDGTLAPLTDLGDVITHPTDASDRVHVWMLPDDIKVAGRILADLATLQAWLPTGLVPTPDRTIACGSMPMRAYLNAQTLDLVGVAAACSADSTIHSDVPGAAVERLVLSGVTLARVRANDSGRFAEGVKVTGARELSVEEIIARHQAAAARQAADIRTQISTGTLTLTFEAPGFTAPIAVTSETVIYESADRVDLQQRDIRVNGVSFKGNGGPPRLPIIEPERVASLPLAIALTKAYRYALRGRETLDGVACYVVAFSPQDRDASLYRGRAWIAVDGFGLVRVSAVQTGLRGPITASEQIDVFKADGSGHWLLAQSDVRQTYEGAAVRTPIHRLLVVDRHDVNPPDFIARRDAAYASTDVMLRDTPQGFRYLSRSRAARDAARSPATGVVSEPVLAGRADRVRTLAFGVIVDPNISEPLPFAGLSYVDFNLFNRGAQLNVFFGGTYGQLAFSAPSLGGTRWQLGARAFGIASSYNDRAFEHGREIYSENIEQRPAQASAWLLHPLAPRVSFRLGYEWDYTRLAAGDQTSPQFVVPANQVVHAALIGLDLQRAGWQASVSWSPAWRAGWRSWGAPGTEDFRAPKRDFQRYGASLSRSAVLRPGVTTRVEAAAMGGQNLDRFSRYAFGTFDNRLHGYPSALIRYDHGAVLRTAIAWAAAKAVRLDGFADTAAVHDPGFSTGLRNYTGFGLALEAPAPFRTLLALEWGYGLRGVNTDGSLGTQVVRLTGYKVF